MADGYDRFDSEGSGGSAFIMGLLTGTVLGAGLGMLFAPKAGSELRNQLSEQAGTLANQASEGYRRAANTAGEWTDKGREKGREAYEKGRETYDKAREAVSRGTEEAQKYVREATNATNNPLAGAVGSSEPRRTS